MRYKNLGTSGLVVSEICPGTTIFGGRGQESFTRYAPQPKR
jgi:hypothetical protein